MNYLICCIFFTFTFNSTAQKVLNLIHRVELKIEKSKYTKALELLNKAELLNYDFCGISDLEVKQLIVRNRLLIFDAKNEALHAANELNKLDYYFSENLDSIKMTYFLKVIDKAIIKMQIDSCLNKLDTIKYEDLYINFPLNVNFSNKPFLLTYKTLKSIKRATFKTTEENSKSSNLDRFKDAVRKEAFYLMLL